MANLQAHMANNQARRYWVLWSVITSMFMNTNLEGWTVSQNVHSGPVKDLMYTNEAKVYPAMSIWLFHLSVFLSGNTQYCNKFCTEVTAIFIQLFSAQMLQAGRSGLRRGTVLLLWFSPHLMTQTANDPLFSSSGEAKGTSYCPGGVH